MVGTLGTGSLSDPLPLQGQASRPFGVVHRTEHCNAGRQFFEARESFKAVLDRVEADADVTLITRRHAQGAVVMSLNTYNSLMETVHRLRSPANAAHPQRSLEQAERGELLAHPLIEADPLDAEELDAGS